MNGHGAAAQRFDLAAEDKRAPGAGGIDPGRRIGGNFLDRPPQITGFGVGLEKAVQAAEISIDQNLVDARLAGKGIDAEAAETIPGEHDVYGFKQPFPGFCAVTCHARALRHHISLMGGDIVTGR